jgi:hypothetical protein
MRARALESPLADGLGTAFCTVFPVRHNILNNRLLVVSGQAGTGSG